MEERRREMRNEGGKENRRGRERDIAVGELRDVALLSRGYHRAITLKANG